MKNLFNRRSVISSWEWTRPSVPHSEGTLETLQPCHHAATAQSSSLLMQSLAQLHLAAWTVPLRQADAMALIAVDLAQQRFWVAMAQAEFHQGAALGWNGCLLQKIFLLVPCMSEMRPATACSTSSAVGEMGISRGGVQALNILIQSPLRSGSITKPRLASEGGGWQVGPGEADTWRSAWSELRLPSQSILRLVKMLAWITASLYQARSMTESCSWSAPLHVTSPGVFARVRRFLAAHSSTFLAQLDQVVSGGDQDGEWVLKSPIISVGIKASMSRSSRALRLLVSRTS